MRGTACNDDGRPMRALAADWLTIPCGELLRAAEVGHGTHSPREPGVATRGQGLLDGEPYYGETAMPGRRVRDGRMPGQQAFACKDADSL